MLRVVITKNHMVYDCINMNAQNKANLYRQSRSEDTWGKASRAGRKRMARDCSQGQGLLGKFKN